MKPLLRLALVLSIGISSVVAQSRSADIRLFLDPKDKPISSAIPADFASISFEWSESIRLSNSPTFRTLLKYLKNEHTGQGINVRVGGDSADETWWNDLVDKNLSASCDASYDRKHCVWINMNTDILLSLYHMAQDVNGTLILDLTMAQNHTADWAVEEAVEIFKSLKRFPDFDQRVEGLEIGNEQDMFDLGRRSPGYTAVDFQKELSMYMKALLGAIGSQLPRPKYFRGGGFAWKKDFTDQTDALIQQYADNLYSWSFHRYPTLACKGKEPTMADLLSESATHGIAASVAQRASFAVAHNISYHIGETNSAACGGLTGLSDTMASAIWALDYMFELAQHNVSRVNYHGGRHAPYSWFWVNSTTGVPSVKPLYYAMYVWTQIPAPPGTKLMPLHCRGPGCRNDHESSSLCQNGYRVQDLCLGLKCRDSDCKSEGVRQPCSKPGDTGCRLKGDATGQVKVWALTNSTSHYKVILINKLLDPRSRSQIVRVYAPFKSANGPYNSTSQPELMVLRPDQSDSYNRGDGLSSKELTYGGLTWKGSQAGEQKGYRWPSNPPQRQRDSDGNYYYEIQLAYATIAVFSFQVDPSLDVVEA